MSAKKNLPEKLDVTETLVERLINEVGPMVEEAIGWPLGIPDLHTVVLPKDRGYEDILLARLRGAGVNLDADDNQPRSIVERLVEYVIENNVLAAYEPSTQQLLVIRENVDDSNLDGLKLVIAHELVHRGQHLNHPEFFDRMDRIIREIFLLLKTESANFKEALQKLKEVEPIMTLLESHAHYVQELLHKSRFPAARVESHFNLPYVLLRLLGAKKLAQYKRGVPAVSEAMLCGKIELLYAKL